MNYGLLIGLGPVAAIAGFVVSGFICMIIQEIYKLKGKGVPNVNPLFAILIFPCWIIIWFISYCIIA